MRINDLAQRVDSAKTAYAFYRQLQKDSSTTMAKQIPVLRMHTSFLNTVEGCYLWNCDKNIFDIALKAFHIMPMDIQDLLEIPPKEGDFEMRMDVWDEAISSVAPSDQYEMMIEYLAKLYTRLEKKTN